MLTALSIALPLDTPPHLALGGGPLKQSFTNKFTGQGVRFKNSNLFTTSLHVNTGCISRYFSHRGQSGLNRTVTRISVRKNPNSSKFENPKSVFYSKSQFLIMKSGF